MAGCLLGITPVKGDYDMEKFRVFWKKHKTNIIFFLVGTIIIIGMCIWGIWIFPKLVSSVSVRGRWGDSFGVVTALFTGLAFVILIWTLHVQKDELRLQRGEIRGQKKQLRVQSQTLQKQNFESSFFQLLGVHNANFNVMNFQGAQDLELAAGLEKVKELIQNMANQVSVTENQIQYRVYYGRDCFTYILQGLRNIYNYHEQSEEEERSQKEEELLTKVGHYFRHLYQVVKFVDEQKDFPKKFEEKKRYTDLIHAQLSNEELCVLLYLGRSEQGAKFKVLVEKYALFENMPLDLLINEADKDLYAPSAYGESD